MFFTIPTIYIQSFTIMQFISMPFYFNVMSAKIMSE